MEKTEAHADHDRMPFGRYRGLPFYEIPDYYLNFVLGFTNPPTQANLRRPIQAELERRKKEADLDRAIANTGV